MINLDQILPAMENGARLVYDYDADAYMLGGVEVEDGEMIEHLEDCDIIERCEVEGDPMGVGAVMPFRIVR